MRALLTVLAAALVAAGTGCGGGEEADDGVPTDTGGATFTLTTAETDVGEARPAPAPDQGRWASEVDAACAVWQERLDELEPPRDAAALAPFLAESLPLIRRQIEAVEEVEPPQPGSDDAAEAELLVADMRRVEEALTRYHEAVVADDPTAAQAALAAAGEAGAQTRERAQALGVTACGGYAGG